MIEKGEQILRSDVEKEAPLEFHCDAIAETALRLDEGGCRAVTGIDDGAHEGRGILNVVERKTRAQEDVLIVDRRGRGFIAPVVQVLEQQPQIGGARSDLMPRAPLSRNRTRPRSVSRPSRAA